MVQVYAGKQRASQAPHLFAIAEEAYTLVAGSPFLTFQLTSL